MDKIWDWLILKTVKVRLNKKLWENVTSKIHEKDFPVIQWLRLQVSNAKCEGSIPGQGTRIPYDKWCSQKETFLQK